MFRGRCSVSTLENTRTSPAREGLLGGAGKPHSQPELLCKLTAQSAAGSRSQPGHQGCVQPAVAVRMQMTSSLSQKKGQSELLRAFPEETLQTLSRGRTVNWMEGRLRWITSQGYSFKIQNRNGGSTQELNPKLSLNHAVITVKSKPLTRAY